VSTFKILEPDLQIEFHHRLEQMRETYLLDALLAAVSMLDIPQIDQELRELVSNSSLQKVAGWGLRGEIVFAVPCVLKSRPTLLGYYRLLLGFSQKQFYGERYGFAPFKPMEEAGRLTSTHLNSIRELCQALCGSAELLVAGIRELSRNSVHELTLLTVGPQPRGGVLNALGSRATRQVFELIDSRVTDAIVSSSQKSFKLHNAAGRVVRSSLQVILIYASRRNCRQEGLGTWWPSKSRVERTTRIFIIALVKRKKVIRKLEKKVLLSVGPSLASQR
jgi:hypothetical protein